MTNVAVDGVEAPRARGAPRGRPHTCSLCGALGHKARSAGRICCPTFATTPDPIRTRQDRAAREKTPIANVVVLTYAKKKRNARFSDCAHQCKAAMLRGRSCQGVCIGCGTVFTRGLDATLLSGLCCLVDPRACPNDKHLGRRLPGDWCLWCGEPCVEGQSFCNKRCSVEYEQDVGCVFRNRPMRTVDVVVGGGDPWARGAPTLGTWAGETGVLR